MTADDLRPRASTGESMWIRLRELKPIAMKHGFGSEWNDMMIFRTTSHCERAVLVARNAWLKLPRSAVDECDAIFEAMVAANAAVRAIHICKSIDAVVQETVTAVEAALRAYNRSKETSR